jgi:hypothetical protein
LRISPGTCNLATGVEKLQLNIIPMGKTVRSMFYKNRRKFTAKQTIHKR